MEEITHTIHATICMFDELTAQEQDLFRHAVKVRQHAQSPYSKFAVGAAVRAKNGEVFSGCNVERCTYSETTHAEQNAIDSMIAALGPTKIEMLAFIAQLEIETVLFPPEVQPGATISSFDQLSVPCGHCLQIIWENCCNDPKVKLLSLLPNGLINTVSIGSAFPIRFGPRYLNC